MNKEHHLVQERKWRASVEALRPRRRARVYLRTESGRSTITGRLIGDDHGELGVELVPDVVVSIRNPDGSPAPALEWIEVLP